MSGGGSVPFKWGTRYSGTNYFIGNQDEGSIFDYSLTSIQAADIYNGGTPISLNNITPGPVHYWRNGDSIGDVYPTILDVGSLATNNITMQNMTAGDIVSDTPP